MRGYKRISYEEVKKAFEREGCILLSTNYVDAKAQLKYICSCGRENFTCWNYWQRGQRCKICSRNRGDLKRRKNKDIDELVNIFAREGYRLLETVYRNVHSPLSYLCPQGHSHAISLQNWRKGVRCPECRLEEFRNKKANERVSLETFKILLEQEGYLFISAIDFQDSKSLVFYQCPNGHRHYINWNNWQQKHRCPKCQPSRSKQEQDLQKAFEKFKIGFETNNRELIFPKEVDFYFPDQKVAIEYCGLYWHCELQERVTSNYHYQKMKSCNEKGGRLITIFEDEWRDHKELCLSRISTALGVNQKKIFARKCELKKISSKEAKDFLQKYHLQGSSGREIAFGLFYEESLVSVMTLGKPSRAHVSKKMRTLELKRFASLPNIIVVGGASKLFKTAIIYAKRQEYQRIVSYCDLRWGTGNVYKKLGMKLLYISKYTPHYTDFIKRWRNQKFAGNKCKSEKEKTKEAKVYKIYDCGHQTWELLL